MFRDLTLDDLADKITMKGNHLDILAATVGRAVEILHEEEEEAAAAAAPYPKRRKRAQSDAADERKECNSPKNNLDRQPAPPAMPAEFQCAIEEMARERETTATAARLVIEKGLFGTDLSRGHNRLSIPRSQIADDFLTAEERELLRGRDEGRKKKFMEVRIVQPSLAPETVKFSRWDMRKDNGGKTSSSYIINGKWNAIVERNKLRVGMMVQLWCFRIERELCFALVRLPRN